VNFLFQIGPVCGRVRVRSEIGQSVQKIFFVILRDRLQFLCVFYLIPDICYDIEPFGYIQSSYFIYYIVFARYVFQERKLGTADTDT